MSTQAAPKEKKAATAVADTVEVPVSETIRIDGTLALQRTDEEKFPDAVKKVKPSATRVYPFYSPEAHKSDEVFMTETRRLLDRLNRLQKPGTTLTVEFPSRKDEEGNALPPVKKTFQHSERNMLNDPALQGADNPRPLGLDYIIDAVRAYTKQIHGLDINQWLFSEYGKEKEGTATSPRRAATVTEDLDI